MRSPNLLLLVVFLLSFMANVALADHYYGGCFFYETIGDKTVKVSLVAYTDSHNSDSDKDAVSFNWGDGESSNLVRNNNDALGKEIYEGMKKNIYEGTHEYATYANYQLFFSGNYRLKDVKNMAIDASGATSLRIDGIVPMQDSMVYCVNKSPVPLVDPYFYGKQGQEFQLNFGYYDSEGDSLTYVLTDCQGFNGDAAQGYFIPDDVSINFQTGQFKWLSPKMGKYCFAFEIAEYRNGDLIGKSKADFTLFISHPEYFSFERGTFTRTPAVPSDLYSFGGPSTTQFVFNYQNEQADSINCVVFSALNQTEGFQLVHKQGSQGSSSVDTVKLVYEGGAAYEGFQPLVMECSSFYGEEGILKEVSYLGISADDADQWPCEVPDIREVFEEPPKIPSLTISPNLSQGEVWINVGTAYQSMTLKIFDTRGRLVRSYFNLSGSTVKLDLNGLGAAMYLLQVSENSKVVFVGKMIKI